ncbi:MAG: TonB-dependent receptor [Daejeonella sp.]
MSLRILLILFLLYYGNYSIAQETIGTINGNIKYADGKPAQDIPVFIKEALFKTLTSVKGEYFFKLPAANYSLIVHDGFKTQEINITVNAGEQVQVPDILLKENPYQLQEVVVTGQFEPQSIQKSVYQVRTISNQRIRMRNATNLQEILSTELGVRFSNDLTTGTSDISLMGMGGQGVKILLDGVPMFDPGSTKESLGQIDVNTIDRIEVVEGPMSVSYGTDALAGVINVITKKTIADKTLLINARVQEESAGKEYNGFSNRGVHNQHLDIQWAHNHWLTSGSLTRNTFGGWQGNAPERQLQWKPKNQWLGAIKTGYKNEHLQISYSLKALDEVITSYGPPLPNDEAIDQDYISNRWLHQLEAEWKLSDKFNFNGVASYTDYSRQTQTTTLNTLTGKRTLTPGEGIQDTSVFNSTFFRGTGFYKLSTTLSFQSGIEVNLNKSTGGRILGSPHIADYALFISSEINLSSKIHVRPGVRLIKNSVYNAPPVIPSINTKFSLAKELDLRLAYARGFRAPALRELYFNFIDASHTIIGNEDLKAEYSNSFTGSLNGQFLTTEQGRLKTILSGFYNSFNQLITYGTDPKNPGVTTYINIDQFKTVGGTLENTWYGKNLQVSLGLSYIGRYNKLSEESETLGELPSLIWAPELNSTITYLIPKLDVNLALFYKFSGKKPSYETFSDNGQTKARLAEISDFHLADLTLSKMINSYIILNGGVKNMFNITDLNNSSLQTGGAHSTGGNVPMGYGRSFFMGLAMQWKK